MNIRIGALIALSLLLAACSAGALAPAEQPTEAAQPTATEAVAPTEVPPTEEPEPTATPDFAATEAASVAAAQAEALAEIEEELEEIGYSIDDGELAFVQTEPFSITVNQQSFGGIVESTGDDTSYKNFIMGVDITWETKTGVSGCGMLFRSEDLDDGRQLQFYTMRLSGAPSWGVEMYRYGTYQAYLGGDYNNVIDAEQGDENDYIIIGDGLTITFYANGTRLGVISAPAALESGQFAFLAWQDSGQTTCTFEDMWVLQYPD